MNHQDFTIGQSFWTPTGEWRCTDVGTRTIAAIKLDHPDDPSWYNGPTYAVAEHVFDEDGIQGCCSTLAELQAEFPDFDPAQVPRGKIVTIHLPHPVVRLVLTCQACPEQYDAFLGDRQIGYLRLRHGWFRVDAPRHSGVAGTTIFEANPKGDGCFDDDERDRFLRFAVDALLKFDRGEWEKPEELPPPNVRYEIEGGPPGWPVFEDCTIWYSPEDSAIGAPAEMPALAAPTSSEVTTPQAALPQEASPDGDGSAPDA